MFIVRECIAGLGQSRRGLAYLRPSPVKNPCGKSGLQRNANCSICVEILLDPSVEDEQAPDARPARAALEEIRPDVLDSRSVEHLLERRRKAGKLARDLLAKHSPQPVFPRQRKGPLSLVYDFVGKQALERTDEEALWRLAVPLCRLRQPRHRFNQGMIEEGYANLQRVGHTHGIGVA